MSSAPPAPAPPPPPAAACASPSVGEPPLPPATPLHLSVLRPLSFHSPQPTPLSARRPSVLTYTPPPSKDAMPSQLVQRPSRSTSVSSGSEPYYRGSPHHTHQQQHGMPPPHSLLMSPHTPDQRYNDRMIQDSPMDGGPTYIVRTRDVEQTPPSVGGTPRARRNSTPKAVKIFQCSGYGHCTMTFTRSEHLARHVRKHTGEKPFVCHCSKQFSRIDNLRQHCATVHSELADQNEATIKSLLPVHSALSQQAGRKHNPNARARQQPAHPPSPPRRQPNKLAPIGEHEMSPYHHASSSDAGHDSGHDAGHARPGASPHEHVRQPSAGRRFQSSQPESVATNDGRLAGWNTGLRLSWNGEGDPPEGLGLVKRDSSSIGSSMWPEDRGRASRPIRHEPMTYDEGESEIGSGSEEDEVAYHRRGSDSNVQFGQAWAPTQMQHHPPIPPPVHFHPTNSNFSAPQHHLQPPSEANTPSTSSLLTFPSLSGGSGPFPSSAQSTQMPTSATGTLFGLSPLLDVGGPDSRPGSRPTSRGASLDLSYSLPWGASSTTTFLYQLHQHPAFGSALLALNLSSGGEKINEHQSTFRPDSYHEERNTRQIFLPPAPIGGRTIHDNRQHPETLAPYRQDTRAPSPPPQSMLWGLPQLTPRTHRLASISQQGNQGGMPSPQSSRSSVQWGADGAAMAYAGGRQEASKVQRRMSLPYAHHDHHPSYALGNQRPHPQQQYHYHPQHPGMTSYHSDTFVPQVNHEGHHIDSPHHTHQSNPHPHQNPHGQPPVHLRGFSSTPVHCVSLPTQHHAIPDHSPFSYHAPSSSRAFGSALHSHDDMHHAQGGGSSLGTDMFGRPLAISPALPVEDLSPLTIAPDLPRLGDRHDDLPPHSESASCSSSLGTTNTTPSSSGHSSSNGTSDRSPSPANLEVHLSLDPHAHHKHARIFSGPMVTSAPLPPSFAASSFPMVKDPSNTSTISTSSLDSATGFPREKRRTSLALSVSELMGPSVECGTLSRPQTSAGVMEVVGERDAEGEEEVERPRTAGGSL